jgi:hypothetical protein
MSTISKDKIAYHYLEQLKAANPKIQKACSQKNKTPFLGKKPKSPIEQKILSRIKIAIDHYVKGDPSLLASAKGIDLLKGHMNGIDFTMPVTVEKIEPDTQLSQIQARGKGMGETRQGNYYAAYKSEQSDVSYESDLRGIADSTINEWHEHDSGHKFYIDEKEIYHYTTTQEIEALVTTAEKIKDTWSMRGIAMETTGGGRQIHINATENLTVKSRLREKWEKVLELMSTEKMLPQKMEKAMDTINTYAMVLYNRAAFNKDLLNDAIDAYLHLYSKFNDFDNERCQEAIDITKNAIIMAIQKHENLNYRDAKDLKKAEDMADVQIEARRQKLQSAPQANAKENKPKPKG